MFLACVKKQFFSEKSPANDSVTPGIRKDCKVQTGQCRCGGFILGAGSDLSTSRDHICFEDPLRLKPVRKILLYITGRNSYRMCLPYFS